MRFINHGRNHFASKDNLRPKGDAWRLRWWYHCAVITNHWKVIGGNCHSAKRHHVWGVMPLAVAKRWTDRAGKLDFYITSQFDEIRHHLFPVTNPTHSTDYARKAYKWAWRAMRMQKDFPIDLHHFYMIHGEFGEMAWKSWRNRKFESTGWANVARGLIFATLKAFKSKGGQS